jgi:hypothetical protein
MFLDLAAVMPNKDSDAFVESSYKRYWRIPVDEASQFKISDFLETKNAMIEPTCEKLLNLKEENKTVKYIRCDNGGENQGLKNNLNSVDWKLPIRFEFAGRDTTQRNYLAEVGLATTAARGKAMMSAAKVRKEFCQFFWREAFQTSTYSDGLILTTVNGVTKTSFEHWENCLPRFVQCLRKWGEAGVVKLRSSTTPKIIDCGKICMFVGYSPNHAADTLRMWDPDTKRVNLTRDIVWLNKMFFNNNPDFINVPERPNKYSRNTQPTTWQKVIQKTNQTSTMNFKLTTTMTKKIL